MMYVHKLMGPWRGAVSVTSLSFEITTVCCVGCGWKREGWWWKPILGWYLWAEEEFQKIWPIPGPLASNLVHKHWPGALALVSSIGLDLCDRFREGVQGIAVASWKASPPQRRGSQFSHSDCPLYCSFHLSKLRHFCLLHSTHHMRLVRIQSDTAPDSLPWRLAHLRSLVRQSHWHPESSFVFSRGPDSPPLISTSKEGTSKRAEGPLWLVWSETVQLSLELQTHWLILSKPSEWAWRI